MGRFKDQFVDPKEMTTEELAEYKVKLAASGRKLSFKEPSKPTKNTTIQTNLVYKKSFSKRERDTWRGELRNNQFVIYHMTHQNELRNQLSHDLTVKDYLFALKLLKRVNLLRFLGIKVGCGQNFPCPIIAGNLASANFDDEGNWEYFSRNKEKTEGYVFGIVDLMQLLYNLNFYEALDKLCEMLLITVEEAQWRRNQRAKYIENIECIRQANSTLATNYPDLYKYIKRHLYLLDEMNRLGIDNLTTEQDAIERESVFFASTRYIKEKLKERGIDKDRAIVTKLLNMFASLGMIQKVLDDQIPDHLKDGARKAIAQKENRYTVTFYRIPGMTPELFMEANRRATLLKQAGIKATGITSDNLGDVLGFEVLNSVYGDDGRKGIIRAIKDIKQENCERRYAFEALFD